MKRNKFTPVIVTVKSKEENNNQNIFLGKDYAKHKIDDERLFISKRKLNTYLKMVNTHYKNITINVKQYKIN